MNNRQFIFLALILAAAISFILLVYESEVSFTPATVTITAEVAADCGDGVAELHEICDSPDLRSQSCASKGFSGGTLSCNADCTFNTSQCTSVPPSAGGGGGGGGVIAALTGVALSGRAYPESTITVLKDAQIVATTVAGADANFQVSISGLSGGSYIFGIYSEDNKSNRSSLLTFPVSLTSGVTTQISGVFIAPTIAVDKSEVKRGDNIAIFGQSVPKANIAVAISSEEDFFGKTIADANGVYLYNFDTSPLTMKQHFAKSKAALNGEISSFSKTVSFAVSTKTIAAGLPKAVMKGDLNSDRRVNLVDFSIAAYWYKRPLSAEFKLREVELSGDGKVDLVDFSIMAFYWTG